MGLVLILVVALVSLGLFWLLSTRPISIAFFFLALSVLVGVILTVVLGYWTFGYYTLRYRVDRNGIVIMWGLLRQVIPVSNILRLAPGTDLDPGTRARGFTWRGYYVGTGQDPELGPVLFYATRPREEQLLVVTPSVTYAISPRDRAEFELEYQLRARLGPTVALEQGTALTRLARLGLWQDRWLWALVALVIVANVLLFGYTSWQYPYLPDLLPLHFGILGQVDRIGERTELFLLPIIGLVVWGLNLLLGILFHRRERLATYVLIASALVVQVVLWLAAANIVVRGLRIVTF